MCLKISWLYRVLAVRLMLLYLNPVSRTGSLFHVVEPHERVVKRFTVMKDALVNALRRHVLERGAIRSVEKVCGKVHGIKLYVNLTRVAYVRCVELGLLKTGKNGFVNENECL